MSQESEVNNSACQKKYHPNLLLLLRFKIRYLFIQKNGLDFDYIITNNDSLYRNCLES